MPWAVSQQCIENILKFKKLFSLHCQSIVIIDITKQKTPYSEENISYLLCLIRQHGLNTFCIQTYFMLSFSELLMLHYLTNRFATGQM